MNEKTVVYDREGIKYGKKIIFFENPREMRILSNRIAWKIMKSLSKEPKYPAQIAKELKIYEQSVYYYIRKLISIGAIEIADVKIIKGGTARFYTTTINAFGLELEGGETGYRTTDTTDYNTSSFFNGFFSANNNFEGLIVVGAPDPHGPYKSSSRDGHYGVHLAFYLGGLFKMSNNFIVKLDVDAKAEKNIDENNLIIIGGPGTNIVTAEFNKYLPIKFNEKNFWSGLVDNNGKIYNLDNQGLIAKIKNPYNNEKNILVLAGVRSIGTKAAVIALTNHNDKILKSFNGEDEWALVVQGFDMNSDGKIDYVDIVS